MSELSSKLSLRQHAQRVWRDVKDIMSWIANIPRSLGRFLSQIHVLYSYTLQQEIEMTFREQAREGVLLHCQAVGELRTSLAWRKIQSSLSNGLNMLDFIVKEVSIRWMKCSPWTNLCRKCPVTSKIFGNECAAQPPSDRLSTRMQKTSMEPFPGQ